MYYQNYEDYMRSVLGYPMESQNTYRIENLSEQLNSSTMTYGDTKELEDCYPDIFKMINPIVCETCDRHRTSITRDDIENMVEEVYQKVIINNEIMLKMNIENRNCEKEENRNNMIRANSNRIVSNESTRQIREVENRERRPNNNQFLRDLIKILILNRILRGRGERPLYPAPPFPPQGRPGFSGGPTGTIRPPMVRDYDDYLKF